MQSIKFALSIAVFILTASVAIGQNNKIDSRAESKAKEWNDLIVSVDPSLALSDDQMARIKDVYVIKITDMRKIKQEGLSAEESEAKIKEINKASFKTINKEILSKEQRLARAEAKKK